MRVSHISVKLRRVKSEKFPTSEYSFKSQLLNQTLFCIIYYFSFSKWSITKEQIFFPRSAIRTYFPKRRYRRFTKQSFV